MVGMFSKYQFIFCTSMNIPQNVSIVHRTHENNYPQNVSDKAMMSRPVQCMEFVKEVSVKMLYEVVHTCTWYNHHIGTYNRIMVYITK